LIEKHITYCIIECTYIVLEYKISKLFHVEYKSIFHYPYKVKITNAEFIQVPV